MKVNAYAAKEQGQALEPFLYDLPKLGSEFIDIKVHYCGLCHSDLSMLENEWKMTTYPFVPGHEVVGEIVAVGDKVKQYHIGDLVGLGWLSESCMQCHQCLGGSQHLCRSQQATIVGRHGGFADHVRCHWSWAIPLPENIDMSKAGPLLCGGITVFNPIATAGVKPTDKVGVIGIGGLGHLAIKFLHKWGCEVIAFSSNPDKEAEILDMGASKVIDSTNPKALKSIRGSLNFILNTTNVSLNWNAYIKTLAPKGKLHHVGMVLEPMPIAAGGLIGGEKSVSGSPIGSRTLTETMLDFCVRHGIYPTTEEFALENVNEAMEHLRKGKARYRVVLKVAE